MYLFRESNKFIVAVGPDDITCAQVLQLTQTEGNLVPEYGCFEEHALEPGVHSWECCYDKDYELELVRCPQHLILETVAMTRASNKIRWKATAAP